MPKAEEVTQPNQKSLFAQLNEHFSLDELRELCFELGIDPEGLDLRRKGSFLVDLLRTCEQRGLLPNLVQAVVAKRPFLSDLTALQSVDLGLPEPPFWQRPAFFIPVGILIILTIVTTLVVNFGGDNFIASRILPPTPTATATPLPTMTPTPTATPLPIAVAQPGEQLIVIATFARAEGVADAQAQAEIQRGIQAAAAELDFASLRVEVVPDVLPSDDRPGAAALAELYGASMVIWGSETAVRITTNFLNVSEAPYESGDVQVSVVRPDAYVQFITEDLPSQFVFLSLFAIGQSYYAKGAYDEAIAAIETAVANVTNPDTVANEVGQAYFRLGWLYHEPKADLVSAAAAYDQAIALNDADFKAYFNRGLIFQKNDQDAQAEAYFTTVIALVPDRLDAYVSRALSRGKLGDFDGALTDCNYAIEQDPAFAKAYNNRAIIYGEMGQIKNAVADYETALKIMPDFAVAYFNRAVLYSNIGEFEKSLEDIETAIRINPLDPDLYLLRGFVHDDLGEYETAVADYTESLRLNPNQAEAYTNRGDAYKDLGEIEAAIQDYTTAIELDPTDYYPRVQRGALYLDLLDIEAALADFQTSLPMIDDAETAEIVQAIINEIETFLDN